MNYRKTLFSTFVIALFLTAIPQLFAVTWYVKTGGNDANDGSTSALAKLTIQAMVNSSSVNSGDTILIGAGTYTEQVVLGNTGLTLIGSQNFGTAGRTIIQPPAWGTMTTYTFVTPLVWNGAGKLSSNTLRPVVFVNATNSSVTTNIKGIDIDGNNASMTEGSTQVFAGLVYRFATGTIGGSGAEYVEVRNIKPTGSTNALNNTVGVMFLTRSKPTMQYARIKGYRNIGIGIFGESTSGASSIGDNQPNPTIVDCIVTGDESGSSSSSTNFIQTGVLIANGGRATLRRNHIHAHRSTAGGNRFAYGVYLYDARNTLIGDNTSTKSNGNVVADNEIGLYVRVTVSSIPPSVYTIRQNNFVYNGGTGSGLGLASGKIARYGAAAAVYTTNGAVRFSHSSTSTQYLTLTDNAWGNAEAHFFYSVSSTPYTDASYAASRVAMWCETNGDNITFTSPLSPIHTAPLTVNSTNRGSNTSGVPSVDVDYGYKNFDQLNRAVYAAAIATATIPSPMTTIGTAPVINVTSNVTENESVVITKPIKIAGSGATCDDYPTVTLINGLNEPTVWFYGLSTTDADAFNRQPTRDTMTKVAIMANNTQQLGTSTDGPAVLFTGNTAGVNSPLGSSMLLSSMAIPLAFSGDVNGPHAYSTSQTGTTTLTKRFASFAVGGSYSAKYTRRPGVCSTIVQSNEVLDYYDNLTLAKMILDNVVNVATCEELNDAIHNAVGPDNTTILATATFTCDALVNNTAPINVDAVAGQTLTAHWILNGGGTYNPAGTPRWTGTTGGNVAVCESFTTNQTYGGAITSNRVTVFPPACLQTAVNILTPSGPYPIVAANGNSVVGALSFTETSNIVTINKVFDFRGATNISAAGAIASLVAGNATFNGKFEVEASDFRVLSGTVTSVNGATFGDANTQVELHFGSTLLSNFGGGTGEAIEMALQLIGTSGSRRLELTTNGHGAETPLINKRVFLNGLSNRGSATGTITLDGSGNCLAGGADASSVLRNLNVATVDVYNLTDCIQTAMGRVVDCDNSSQHIEGVGTNATNGSGGTVNLSPSAGGFNQNLEIAKTVTLNQANVILGQSPWSVNTGTLTLRRGANVGGTASLFADQIVMTQCFSAHTIGALNPIMSQAMTLVGTGANRSITLTGYGNTNPLATAGNSLRGVWQFNNITINKDVDIKGTYAGISSNNLTTDCSLLSSATPPSVNAARNLSVETVIGGHTTNEYATGTDKIFNITNSGASVDGISFRNITGGGTQSAVYINAGLSSVSVNNNILDSDKSNSFGLVQNDISGASLSDIDVKNNHILVTTNNMGSPISLGNLTNASGQNEIIGNAADVQNAGTGVVMWLQSVNGGSSTGTLVSQNWFKGGTSHGIFMLANAIGLNGITVEKNRLRNGFGQGLEINVVGIDPGSNGITVKENIIDNQANGIVLSGNYSAMTVNRIFINSNDLSGNTNGVNITGTTDITDPHTNMFDLRFNWWGSDLGPQRGSGIATNPLLATTDSIRLIGHVPFNHNSGALIVDANGTTHGRWMLYPVAVNNADNAGTCGWQVQNMMGPVLRVNSAGNSLLGMYNTIANGRDNASALAYHPAVTGARTGTDQLAIVAGSTYNATSYGYVGSSSNESSYPVQFTADPQPSIIRGLNRPRILGSVAGTGSIEVTSSFPRAFQLRDFVEHVGQSPNYTAISFANGFGNTVDYNFITATNAAPTAFKGITCTNSSPSVAQTFTNNRINLGQNPRWPGGPMLMHGSAPLAFTGIEVPSHGSNGSVTISNNEVSVPSAAPKSVGIYVNAQTNITNSITINSNQIRKMRSVADFGRTSYWGTGIYLAGGNNHTINSNDIQGTTGGSGHDGITLDKPGTGSVNSNILGTLAGQEFAGTNPLTTRERGYGIKLYSSTGTDAIGSVTINLNTIGSASAGAPDVASIYVGGTSSTIGSSGSPVVISNNTILNGRNTANAVVQIAAAQYSGASSAGYVTVEGNTIGSTTAGQSNAMFLAIGTDGVGVGRTGALADNISVNVRNNAIRTSQQAVIVGATREVADARPNAGANIRNIFGSGTGSATNGASTPGNGNSGNNTFTHAAILTSEANHANYTYYTTGLNRTANAVALNTPATTPVTIERLINTPLQVAGNADSANTVELRENSGWAIASEDLYYKETLTFPDRRIVVSGPRSSYAELLPGSGGTGTMFTSTGRENKDIRGAIRINAVGLGLYGVVSVGAANKGDVYLQMDGIGVNDVSPVRFRYDAGSLATMVPVTGLNNGLVRATDIKSGMDDADDDNYTANTSTTRRTGVFRSGTVTSQFAKETPEAITGANVLNVYPNPSSGDVTVAFRIPMEGIVRIALYNALGEKVTDLREGYLSVDNYTTTFNGANLPSGTYHVRLVHDLFTRTVPVTIIK